MVKKIVFSLFCVSIITLSLDITYNNAHTSGSGAISGRTGSPGDGQTCNTSCHSGPAPTASDMVTITSDVPPAGYTPGTIYNITASASASGITKFGFELSPQNISGTKMGSFALPLPSGTQFANPNTGGANKYVTHTSSGTAGAGSKTWTLQWTAPSAGSGTTIFYGAFNLSNHNNSRTGDIIKTGTLVIPENLSIGITETEDSGKEISVFPNPANEVVTISFFMYESGTASAEMYDINGKLVEQSMYENFSEGRHYITLNVADTLEPGLYFIRLNDGKNVHHKKVIVK